MSEVGHLVGREQWNPEGGGEEGWGGGGEKERGGKGDD